MLDEISAAVLFLVRLIEKSENINREQIEAFKTNLSEMLAERFQDHWFPDKPYKGQGYRCIRVNENDRRDETLERAARACGFRYEDLKLPLELTLWIDPKEVCCRFGENSGSHCTLATFNGPENESPSKQIAKIGKTTLDDREAEALLSGNPGNHAQGSSQWSQGPVALHYPMAEYQWYNLPQQQWQPPGPPPHHTSHM